MDLSSKIICMKWKSLRRDEGVKPAWQKGMNYAYNGLLALFFIRVILRLINKAQNNYFEAYEILSWVVIIGFGVFIIPGLVYLVKPSWFLVNKE